ncbi:hypothetical protein H8356DRAFT_1372200 [Neocallimastix lanati (nom. inval.)]|uniref:Uncharacterized protein n=1 Tax=Neocallimastix californiae TaxID=1754190 RepID=A0A1Y2CKJ7_9FUNG|nr:hypothetical protein H8356DRAFT_1372200 [Neocallimastix sp. JGI-2020a]ORY47541.1 hypothetical protein LY90DRAFT_619801 [Neocallimastix californiae]|eukprot:ORY47541.1 hypothetical protein LY90DRAFT_619801 [Neocallimastix californiae]
MNEDLTFFIDKINNLTILSPFRTRTDILVISDASEKGIGSSIFQIKNYELIDKYIESDLDISNNKDKIITMKGSHDTKNLVSHDENFAKNINKADYTQNFLQFILKFKNTNNTLENIKSKLFINSKDNKIADFLSRQYFNMSSSTNSNECNNIENLDSLEFNPSKKRKVMYSESEYFELFERCKQLADLNGRLSEKLCFTAEEATNYREVNKSLCSRISTLENSEQAMASQLLNKEKNKGKTNKGKQPESLNEMNDNADIIITYNNNNMEKELKNLKNDIENKYTKLNNNLINYKYNFKRSKFYFDTQNIIEKYPVFEDNLMKIKNEITNKINSLELRVSQKIRSQEIKINNLNRTIQILQNELEAIRRGLGDLPTYEESPNQSNANDIH